MSSDNLVKISEMSSLTGVCAQTLRNYEASGSVVPNEKSEGGHRRYTREQMYDILRYRNKEEIERYNGRRIILFMKDDILSRLALLYIKYKYKDYKYYLFDVNMYNTVSCINYVSSCGLVDYIYMYSSDYDCLKDVDLFTDRLGIEKVSIVEDENEEFNNFCKSYHCYLLLDLVISQLNEFLIDDTSTYNLILRNLISCVVTALSSCNFKLNFSFGNIKVKNGVVEKFTNNTADSCFNFEFSIQENILHFSYIRDNCLLEIENKKIEEFLSHYGYNRVPCSLFNMYDDSKLMKLCLIQ